MSISSLHQQAVSLARTFRQSEAELLSVLISLERSRGFFELGYPNLFVYCSKGLGLSEAQSCYFLKVVRKSEEVPELLEAVQSGTLSLSQARRVASVITSESAGEWIEKAASLPQKELERAVTVANPKSVVREKIKPVSPERSEMRIGISLELERKLQRVREVLSNAKKTSVSLESALEVLVETFLEKKDPVRKAKRTVLRTVEVPSAEKTAVPQRDDRTRAVQAVERNTITERDDRSRTVPAHVKHSVLLRDGGKCQAVLPSNEICGSGFWVEQHHIRPRSLGGPHLPGNLISLCSQHHRMQHQTP